MPQQGHTPDRKPGPTTQGPKQLSELLGDILKLASLSMPQAVHPSGQAQDTPTQDTPMSPSDIRAMLDSGQTAKALAEGRNVFNTMREKYGSDAELTAIALANLLEYSTVANNRTSVPLEAVKQLFHRLHEISGDVTPRFFMHALPRACEFMAWTGIQDSSFRPLAERSLAQLHAVCPLFSEPERIHHAAEATLRAATHIASWETAKERPDLRSLNYFATCGYERLAQFSQSSAEFYLGVFELRSGASETGFGRLEKLVASLANHETDTVLASLDHLTEWYLRFNRVEDAQSAFTRLMQLHQQAGTLKSLLPGEAYRINSYRERLEQG